MELPFVFDELCLPTLHGPDALLGTEPPPDTACAAIETRVTAMQSPTMTG